MNPKHLIDLLEKENLSLAEVSRKTGVPKSTLGSWIKGRSPNLDQLQKVAEFLNVTLDFLTTGRNMKLKESLLPVNPLILDKILTIRPKSHIRILIRS